MTSVPFAVSRRSAHACTGVHTLSPTMCHGRLTHLFRISDTHATLARQISEKSANEAKLQRQMHPIQKELSRMVRENNQLHLELIQRGEELDTHQKQGAIDMRKLQSKIGDQGFVIAQQAQHITALQKEIEEAQRRMQQLLDPNFTCTSGPAGASRQPKGQEILVSSCPRPFEPEESAPSVAQVSHDLEEATAEQLVTLEEDLKAALEEQEVMRLEMQALQQQVAHRDDEIARMGKLLVNNRWDTCGEEDLETINADNADNIRRLNNQLDFVSGQLVDAERQKAHVQEMAKEVERLRASEVSLINSLAAAKSEADELRQLVGGGRAAASKGKAGAKELERMSRLTYVLARIQGATKQQAWAGLFKGIDTDKDGKVSKHEWGQMVCKRFAFATEEDAALLFDLFDEDGGGEIDAKEFRGKVGEVYAEQARRALVQAVLEPCGGGSSGGGVGRKTRELQPQQSRPNPAAAGWRHGAGEEAALAASEEERRELLESLEQARRRLTECTDECSQLRERVARGDALVEETQDKCEQVVAELAEMKRLRDNLYAVVMDFENQMAEVQTKIKELVAARDEQSRQCAEAMSELDASRARVQALESQLERAESQAADWAAVAGSPHKGKGPASPGKLRPGSPSKSPGRGAGGGVEAHALKAALVATQQELNDKLQEVKSLQAALRAAQLQHEQGGAAGGGGPAEHESKIAELEAKVKEKDRAIEELQHVMASMDQTRGQVVSQLKTQMASAQTGKQQIETLEAEVQRLQRVIKDKEDELVRSKAAIADIDGERDALLNQLDDRSNTVQALEEKLGASLKDTSSSQANVSSMEQGIDMLRRALAERDAHVKALEQQVQGEAQTRQQAEQMCHHKMEEARVLAADLGTMTRENQVVNDELAVVLAQRDALKRDLDEALQRLTVAQQMVQGREKECQDIMMSYKALNDEKQRADTNTDRVGMELHTMRAQVYAREQELAHARETIAALQQEEQRLATDLLGVQRHSDLVSEKLLEWQERGRVDAAERDALGMELAASKNAAQVVEKQKGDAVREGALLRDEIVALRGKLANLGAEKDLLRGTLESEKSKARALEELVASMRLKEHSVLDAASAADSDKLGLAQRLQAALSENEQNAQELRVLRSKREDLEYQLEKHRRLVSSEALDKDSVASELGTLKANVSELQFVVEQQNHALQAKQEELTLQRERLLKIQGEAEGNERRVRELDTKLRMVETEKTALQRSQGQHSASLDMHATEKDELRAALRRTEEQLDSMQVQYRQMKDVEKEQALRIAALSAEKAALEAQRRTADVAS